MKSIRVVLVLGMALLAALAARAATEETATVATPVYTFACGSSLSLTLNAYDFSATSTGASSAKMILTVQFPVDKNVSTLWGAVFNRTMQPSCKLTSTQTGSSGTTSTLTWTLTDVEFSNLTIVGGPGTVASSPSTVATAVNATVSFVLVQFAEK